MNLSPVARGLFINDEDPGSSPLAPLGLHAARLRIKPSRAIQPVSYCLKTESFDCCARDCRLLS